MTIETTTPQAEVFRVSPLGLPSLAARASAIALVYWITRLLAGSVTAALSGARAPDPVAELVAAGIVGATLGWLTPRISGSASARIATVGLALYVNVVAVMIEGAAFAPKTSPVDQLPMQLVAQALVCLAVAGTAVVLLPGDASETGQAEPRRGARWWAVRLAATTSVYVVAYLVTGAINYALVTGPYYETHAGGLVTPAPQVVLGVALLEGLLMSLGMVPLVRRLRAGRRTRLLATGSVLFILGGVVPLVQATNLPDVIRIASTVEILFQKLPLGIAIAGLLGPRNGR